jgi:ABC-type multidrug transport system fused ATPase/permease subunit
MATPASALSSPADEWAWVLGVGRTDGPSTTALDTVSERLVVEALARLRAGRTTFVIAHRLTTVRNADMILVLEKGSIAACGANEALLAGSSLYRELASSMER